MTVKCKICEGPHNACLCDAKSQQSSGEVGGQPTESSLTGILVGTESRIALQITQGLIKGSAHGRVRVLFDSGSNKTFLTAKAESNCGLENVRKEWVTINTFGQNAKESGLRDVIQFDVMPLKAYQTLRLEA